MSTAHYRVSTLQCTRRQHALTHFGNRPVFFVLQEGRADWNVTHMIIVRFLHCKFLTSSDLMINFTTPFAQQLHAWRISILQQRLVFFEPGRQCGELVLQGDLLVAPWKSMLSIFGWQKACRADWEFSSIALPQAGMEGFFWEESLEKVDL